MSRILMIGMGVPAFLPARRHAGPGLRAAHLATALAREGHTVLLACVCRDGEEAGVTTSAPDGIEVVFVEEQRLAGQAMRRRIEELSPDGVVAVTVYAAALAVRLRLGIPMWADIFGDILSEAQAKAARTGGDWSLVHFWSLLAPVLEKADRFSAVSRAHSHAVVGQLGLCGRLSAATAGEALVEVIPCAAEAPVAADDRGELRRRTRRELGIPEDVVAVLCSGGFNTWCDIETLAAALTRAMQADPSLHVLVTGGAIPGHDEHSYARFRELMPAAHGARVHLLGWTDSGRLPAIYACADAGLHIERRLYERRLGAENRVVEWLVHGLPAVTTAQSELGAELVARGLAIPCPAGDPEALAIALAALRRRRDELAATGERGRAFAREHHSYAATAAPLLSWCAAPVFASDHDDARLLRLGLLSHPQGSTEMLEAYVRELSMLELVRRGIRWALRRALGALRMAG